MKFVQVIFSYLDDIEFVLLLHICNKFRPNHHDKNFHLIFFLSYIMNFEYHLDFRSNLSTMV